MCCDCELVCIFLFLFFHSICRSLLFFFLQPLLSLCGKDWRILLCSSTTGIVVHQNDIIFVLQILFWEDLKEHAGPQSRMTVSFTCRIMIEYDLGMSSDPVTFHYAITSSHSQYWIDATHGQLALMTQNEVRDLVELSDGCKPTGSKYVFKTKCNAKE